MNCHLLIIVRLNLDQGLFIVKEVLEITPIQIQRWCMRSITMHRVHGVEIEKDFVPIDVVSLLSLTVALEEKILMMWLAWTPSNSNRVSWQGIDTCLVDVYSYIILSCIPARKTGVIECGSLWLSLVGKG